MSLQIANSHWKWMSSSKFSLISLSLMAVTFGVLLLSRQALKYSLFLVFSVCILYKNPELEYKCVSSIHTAREHWYNCCHFIILFSSHLSCCLHPLFSCFFFLSHCSGLLIKHQHHGTHFFPLLTQIQVTSSHNRKHPGTHRKRELKIVFLKLR